MIYIVLKQMGNLANIMKGARDHDPWHENENT